MRCVEETEVDEMWGVVGKKHEQRWLWHAIAHRTGKVLAYVFSRRRDDMLLKLKALLNPFGITRYLTDYGGAHERHLDLQEHSPGKRTTQKIERKHLTLRTRIRLAIFDQENLYWPFALVENAETDAKAVQCAGHTESLAQGRGSVGLSAGCFMRKCATLCETNIFVTIVSCSISVSACFLFSTCGEFMAVPGSARRSGHGA
jgi:IS1 family transposase